MKNMSRFSKLVAIVMALPLIASCAQNARIDAEIADAASSNVVVKLLDVNAFQVLDTVSLDQAGKFSYKVDVKKGNPEFVYLFHNDVKVASLILAAGDKVQVEADTLGNYTVTGSDESAKLAQVERDYASVLSRLMKATTSSEAAQEYIAYYRACVKYIMENSSSLSVVPVLYQTVGENLPVFGQVTDGIHFRNAADSLELVYPASKYVKALRQEADRRMGYLELQNRIQTAAEISFPDIELPDLQAQKRKLSEVDSKVVMIHFWTAAEASQKMFNLDVLKPVYDEFHKKGFEIYQVSLDVDKGLWARVIKEQALPWINVCDSRGSASPYVGAYNLPAVPATFILANGELVDGKVIDEKSLRRLLRELL